MPRKGISSKTTTFSQYLHPATVSIYTALGSSQNFLSSTCQLQPMSGTSSKPTATSSSPVLHPTSYQLVSTPHDSLNRNRSSSLLPQRSLVLDYLCHNCYINTAKAFARDSTVRQLDADGDEILEVPGDVGGRDTFRLSGSLLAQMDLRKRGGAHPFRFTALTPYFT